MFEVVAADGGPPATSPAKVSAGPAAGSGSPHSGAGAEGGGTEEAGTDEQAKAGGAARVEPSAEAATSATSTGRCDATATAADVDNRQGSSPSKPASSPNKPQSSPRAPSSTKSRFGDAVPPSVGVTATLKSEWKKGGSHAPMLSHAQSLMCLSQMHSLADSLGNATSAAELQSQSLALTEALASSKQLREGLAKAAQSLKGHITNCERAETRKRAKEQKDAEKTAMEDSRKRAKRAAEQLKSDSMISAPIFRTDFKPLVDEGVMQSVKQVSGDSATMKFVPSEPLLILGHPAIKTFLSTPKVQVTLGTFGGTYKKSSDLKSEGRTQKPWQDGQGKEECEAMWSSLLMKFSETIALQDIPQGLQGAFKASWLYGYDMGLKGTTQSPNGCGMLKLLCSGEQVWFLADITKFMAALRQTSEQEKFGLCELCKEIEKVDISRARELHEKGFSFVYAKQVPGQVLYVPPGWLVAEAVTKGILVYGSRKTIAVVDDLVATSYADLIGAMQVDGRNVAKMEQAHLLMSPKT